MDFFSSIPAPAWAAIAGLGSAFLISGGALFGVWITNRRQARETVLTAERAAKVDAGQLALEYAQGLRDDLERLVARVSAIERERDAYRSYSHVLHEWGGYVETTERPRPTWPITLPR